MQRQHMDERHVMLIDLLGRGRTWTGRGCVRVLGEGGGGSELVEDEGEGLGGRWVWVCECADRAHLVTVASLALAGCGPDNVVHPQELLRRLRSRQQHLELELTHTRREVYLGQQQQRNQDTGTDTGTDGHPP